uniref:Uncharacterized protein n=1 Tax=Amphimedon queenslandica TaxID=400682 RepID=A0A1X7TI76_AMPQE
KALRKPSTYANFSKTSLPSIEHCEILNKLYPSCATSSKKFDTLHKGVAKLSQPKKEAAVPSGGKFKSLKAILLRNPLLSVHSVPQGKERQDLIHSQNTSCGLPLKADRSKDMALACISHEMEDFYGYVFSKGHVDPPFSLFATYLRVKIEINATKLQESTIRRGSTIFIKYNSCTSKPSQFYGQSTEV